MIPLDAFLLALFIGTIAGILTASLCAISKKQAPPPGYNPPPVPKVKKPRPTPTPTKGDLHGNQRPHRQVRLRP